METTMDIATSTYAELKDLRDQIEVRLREIERQTFEDLERKARDFGFALHQNGAPPAPRAKKPKLTYRNPDNPEETYGGKGKRPAWLIAQLEAGHEIAEFAVA
jgi:DNA-binding protein H-NS